MATRKHNDFLDADQSDDDGSQGYDSEIEDLRKGSRNPKRRKVEKDISENEDEDAGLDESDRDEQKDNSKDVEKPGKKHSRKLGDLPDISKPLTKKNLVSTAAALKRSGVVYLSRIPPFMKPAKLRSLLEPYGKINRIFLTPEDPTSRSRRVRNGGNKKRSFVDGWVEFVNKAEAKEACELLNARTIGGKKGTYYRDDVWNLLYLKGFKWNNLTEQIAAENAERASRMRAEISKTTKENKEFVQNLERSKMLEGMEAQKAVKRKKADETGAHEDEPTEKEMKKGGERKRHFKQTPVAKKRGPEVQTEQVKRVLSKIF